MAKNIAVIDEQGNIYEATYPKRAKGLVKSGRARFVDEKTICLARPPYKSEDKTMSENMVSKDYSLENSNAEKADSEGMSAEGLSTEKLDSQGLAPEALSSAEGLKNKAAAGWDAVNSTEDLKKGVLAYLDAVQPKSGEEQDKTGEGQGKQSQEKTLSREIVEQVLEQLDHFAADDAYIATLAEKHVDSEDMVNIVRIRETTRQEQLGVYKTVLEKAIAEDAYAQPNVLKQLEQVTDWMRELSRDDFDTDMWEMIQDKAYKLMDSIRTA